ncbi:MAG: hypothetical protein LQ343_007364 [Gyalolechia ehrenbergii]|nr:MAG: hypothetical protein LQ343_007364 [Gyalolechia ehrenbergii]
MAAMRSNNRTRAHYRVICRQQLSDHIAAKLGVSVRPEDVRLITSPDDPYTWQILPEKRHLFTKHLSKHSTGAYRELSRGVGISFEAVTPAKAASSEVPQQYRDEGNSTSEVSFTEVIARLEIDKGNLEAELRSARDRESEAVKDKQQIEATVARLILESQGVEEEKQSLYQQVQEMTKVIEQLRNATLKSVDQIVNSFKIDLDSLRARSYMDQNQHF